MAVASSPGSTALSRAMPSASGVIVTCRALAVRSARSREPSGSSCWIIARRSEARRLRPRPCSASGASAMSRSIRAQVSGLAPSSVVATVEACSAVRRPLRSTEEVPGSCATSLRAEARE